MSESVDQLPDENDQDNSEVSNARSLPSPYLLSHDVLKFSKFSNS